MQEKSKKDRAYTYIKEKICTCKLMPGDFIDEKRLIDEIGASRTPIREALNKLEQENLIQIIPKKGIIVRNISAKNISDIFQVRDMIEIYCIQNFGQNLDKQEAENFKNLFIAQKVLKSEHISNDVRFHLFLTSCNKNDYVQNILQDIYWQSNRIRFLTGERLDCSIEAQKEHTEIISYILKDDYINACESLKIHLTLSRSRTLSLFNGD